MKIESLVYNSSIIGINNMNVSVNVIYITSVSINVIYNFNVSDRPLRVRVSIN